MFPDPLPNSERSLWSLPDDWVFLNPGSFGLRLQEVQQARLELLQDFESQPVEFLERRAVGLASDALDVVASFLGADPTSSKAQLTN